MFLVCFAGSLNFVYFILDQRLSTRIDVLNVLIRLQVVRTTSFFLERRLQTLNFIKPTFIVRDCGMANSRLEKMYMFHASCCLGNVVNSKFICIHVRIDVILQKVLELR